MLNIGLKILSKDCNVFYWFSLLFTYAISEAEPQQSTDGIILLRAHCYF